MKKLLIMLLYLLVFPVCVYAVRYDGPYEGKVIDADTREPIEGVVILGVWYSEYPTPAGAVHEFYDAKEAVTDKNGDFSIPGLGLMVVSNVIPMDVLIFKAGYEHIGMGSWSGLKRRGYKGYEESYDTVKNRKILREVYDQSKKVKWEGDKAIIPLKKLTLKERRERFGSYYVHIPDDKQKLLLKEIEKENKEIGK